jgi:sec-independent protein translocase protein TatB
MIDLSFAKIAVAGFVALLILGPEKLPYAARTAGALLGRMQRYINNVKSEVARDMELEELRRTHAEMDGIGVNIAKQISDSVNEVEKEIKASTDIAGRNGQVKSTFVSREENTGQREIKIRGFHQHRRAQSASVSNWYKKQCRSKIRITPAVSSVIRRRSARYSSSRCLSL